MGISRHLFARQPAFALSCEVLTGYFPSLGQQSCINRSKSSLRRSRRWLVMSGHTSWQHVGHEPSPLTASEMEHDRNAPAPFAKAEINSMSPQEREALRIRSRSIPLVKSDAPLDIVYEDEVFLVVSKPSWLKMHPIHRFQGLFLQLFVDKISWIAGGTLLNRVIGYLGQNPHMCHRLDMHTSGVVMFLKAREHCAAVAEAFRTGRVTKEYLCIVDLLDERRWEDDTLPPFTVDAPIERHPSIGILRQIGDSSSKSKSAVTDFKCASHSANDRTALLSVSPRTGRTHQIRIHARKAGFPIVGDDIYGRERECYNSIEHVRECARDPAKALFLDDNPLRAGLKLHAWQISVDHPVTKEPITFCAAPPARFLQLSAAYGLSVPVAESA